ncbi:MAG: drug resistance transporter, EmrB/QacA subfamily, partial [Actinomycetia bacterium]|nr:drug resistance transporter, EmrB/QacA subfamily [Actinomycetes bacterium]
LLPLGAIGDRWGRKPMLLAGLTIFGVASAAAGLAPSTEVMLAARLLSGVGDPARLGRAADSPC